MRRIRQTLRQLTRVKPLRAGHHQFLSADKPFHHHSARQRATRPGPHRPAARDNPRPVPQARRIEWQDVSGLQPDPLNPKTHDLPTIDDSLGRFGMLEPVVIDGRTNQILAGHGRVQSLRDRQARGEDPPEGVQVKNGTWLTPVVTGWSSANDDEAHAAMIALNRTTELGGWDENALLTMLESLNENDALLGVGYAQDDLAILRESVFTDSQQTFLEDMTQGTEERPFGYVEVDDPRHTWMMQGRAGEVSLQFPMGRDQRTACVKRLRELMHAEGLDTMTDALLTLLGIPLTPPEPPAAPEREGPEGEREGAPVTPADGSTRTP